MKTEMASSFYRQQTTYANVWGYAYVRGYATNKAGILHNVHLIQVMGCIYRKRDFLRSSVILRCGKCVKHGIKSIKKFFQEVIIHLIKNLLCSPRILRKNKLVHLPAGLFDATTELKVL